MVVSFVMAPSGSAVDTLSGLLTREPWQVPQGFSQSLDISLWSLSLLFCLFLIYGLKVHLRILKSKHRIETQSWYRWRATAERYFFAQNHSRLYLPQQSPKSDLPMESHDLRGENVRKMSGKYGFSCKLDGDGLIFLLTKQTLVLVRV